MLNQKQKFQVTKYEDNDLSFLLKKKEKKIMSNQIKDVYNKRKKKKIKDELLVFHASCYIHSSQQSFI